MRSVIHADAPDVDPYPYLTALVVPRPIAWVSTISEDGVGNLAPHSFFGVACAHPPIISITSVGSKDTVRNVRATGELVVNLAPVALMDEVNDSSAPFEADVDEARRLALATEPSARVRPERLVASPASLECRLHSAHDLGDSVLVLAEVLAFTVDEDVLVDGHPEFERLAPLARLGRAEWALPGEVVSTPRPRTPDDVAPR